MKRVPQPLRGRLFKFGSDDEFARGIVILDAQNIRLAADLAVFDVALALPGGLVNCGDVPLSAGSALETGVHGMGGPWPRLRVALRRAYLSGQSRASRVMVKRHDFESGPFRLCHQVLHAPRDRIFQILL